MPKKETSPWYGEISGAVVSRRRYSIEVSMGVFFGSSSIVVGSI